MFNITKIREQMLANGSTPEAVEAYITSLQEPKAVPTATYVARPKPKTPARRDDFVISVDGTVCRRSDAIASDSDPWDTRR